MPRELLNLLSTSHSLCEIDFLTEAANEMSPKHSLGLADNFKLLVVEACLGDTVLKLNDQHVLLYTTKLLRHELHTLNFIAVESSVVAVVACYIVVRSFRW